jgi:hypothetical protein
MAEPHLPTARECAILLLLLIETRANTTRVRLSELTLKRLWTRGRLPDGLIEKVTEYMFKSGWCLFYAETTFAAVRISVVENWPRLSSKRMENEIRKIQEGAFKFDRYTHLVSGVTTNEDDD